MNPAKRREIFLRLQATNPHPTTELEYKTPFELLVTVMLTAQISSRRVLFGVQFYLLPWRLI